MVQKQRKKGNLAQGSKAPPFRGGLDWDAIMHNHRPREEWGEPIPESMQLTIEEIDRRNRGLKNYYSDRKPQERKAPGRKGQGRHTTFDIDEAVRLYTEEHLTPAEIGERIGVKTPATVVKYLKRAEVYDPKKYRPGGTHSRVRPPTRPAESYKRKDRCVRDHDLTLPGATREAPRKKGANGQPVRNGRICVECKKQADRDAYNWDEDPRNPKNGGNSGWTEERLAKEREKRALQRKEKDAVLRKVCPECEHSAFKHGQKCDARDCRCLQSHTEVKMMWAEIEARDE